MGLALIGGVVFAAFSSGKDLIMAAALILMVPVGVLALNAAIRVHAWGRNYRLDRLKEERERPDRAAHEAWLRDGGQEEDAVEPQ
jgi:hypothetical protein